MPVKIYTGVFVFLLIATFVVPDSFTDLYTKTKEKLIETYCEAEPEDDYYSNSCYSPAHSSEEVTNGYSEPTETTTQAFTETSTEKPTDTTTEELSEPTTEKPTEITTEEPTETTTEESNATTTEEPTETTTEELSETTTEEPTETTTEEPAETTTEEPTETTTEEPTEITTEEPTETTTEGPTETTTEEPTKTTTEEPTEAPSSEELEGTYQLKTKSGKSIGVGTIIKDDTNYVRVKDADEVIKDWDDNWEVRTEEAWEGITHVISLASNTEYKWDFRRGCDYGFADIIIYPKPDEKIRKNNKFYYDIERKTLTTCEGKRCIYIENGQLHGAKDCSDKPDRFFEIDKI